MKKVLLILAIISISQSVGGQTLIPFRDGNNWGYSDEKGNIIIEPEYEETNFFFSNIVAIKKHGKYGFINRQGILLTDFEFEKAGYWRYGLLYSNKDGKTTCYKGNLEKTECLYGCGTTSSFKNPQFRTYKKEGKIGTYTFDISKDSLGKAIIRIDSLPATWDGFRENYKGLAAVKKGNKWGLINEENKTVIGFEYDMIEVDNAEKAIYCFRISNNDKFGFIDENGKLIIEPKYLKTCLLYTSPSPRDATLSRMPSSA